MKVLLWKEYRQHRQLIAASVIVLAAPYLVVLLVGLFASIKYGPQQPAAWDHNLAICSTIALALTVLLCAFFAGNAIAGERGDRSAEFVAYLPLARWSTVASKAMIAIGACAVMLIVNSLVLALFASGLRQEPSFERGAIGVVWVMWITAAFVFGVAWAVSSMVTRPATAAASSLAAVLILIFLFMLIEEALGPDADMMALWYPVNCLVIAAAGITAGTTYYLHRVEP